MSRTGVQGSLPLTTHFSLQNECLNRKGSVIGRCANGFAACCSFKFTCGADTSQNETLFVNRQYPQAENDTNTCQVTIKKMDNICQLRLGKSICLLAHKPTPRPAPILHLRMRLTMTINSNISLFTLDFEEVCSFVLYPISIYILTSFKY